ncbi:MAG: GntP family permease [Flavobacteriaceae bacterium]|nr:GntP family permease [Flavobacteriaceae bacterium]
MTGIFIALLIGILFIVVSTTRWKLHPFLALLLTTFGLAFYAGIPVAEVTPVVLKGFGNTIGSIGIIIIAGTIIGVMLEKSGATLVISRALIRLVTEKRPTLALSAIGYIVSIPVFCDSAFVILSSLNHSLSKKTKTSIVPLSIALASGLFAPHVLIPPTPGPIAAAANLHADNLLLVILTGLVVAVPVTLTGFVFSNYLKRKYPYIETNLLKNETEENVSEQPSLILSLLPILIPIFLMALGTVFGLVKGESQSGILSNLLIFIGNPTIALLIGMFVSFRLIPRSGRKMMNDWMGEGLKNAAVILMITGVGGALGSVIQQLPLKEILSSTTSATQLGLLLPFVIAAVVKTAQGSSTVAIITTSAILYPSLGALGLDSEMGKSLAIMAIGSGSMVVSHANDSYFWVVSQFSGMSVKTAYQTHTVASLLQGIVGLLTVMGLGLIFI